MRSEQQLVNLLKAKQLTISFAESISCGLAAHKLATVSGTSEILMGSAVCYNENVKTKLLRVSKSLIEKHTAESQPVTDQLALNLGKIIPADICAAVTGLAAPGGSETKLKPVGTVFMSMVFRNNMFKLKKKFKGSPLDIRTKACDELFKFIFKNMKLVLNGEK